MVDCALHSHLLTFSGSFHLLVFFYVVKYYATLQKCPSYISPVSATLGTNPISRHLSPRGERWPRPLYAPFTPRVPPSAPLWKTSYTLLVKLPTRTQKMQNFDYQINAKVHQERLTSLVKVRP